jgi:hypothetical protein
MPRAVAVGKKSFDLESMIDGFLQNVRDLISLNEAEERSVAADHSKGVQVDLVLTN